MAVLLYGQAMESLAYDAVILAGGQARRLHGASKPDVMLAGRRLVDHSLASVSGSRRRVLVGPSTIAAPPGVLRTQESPAHGGPVAGIEAGLRVLHPSTTPQARPLDDTPVLVLACDMPLLASAVPLLLARLAQERHATRLDGACLVDDDGRVQWLAALYRPSSLHRALRTLTADGGIRNAPVRRLASLLSLAEVPVHGRECTDIDTWADHALVERMAAHVVALPHTGSRPSVPPPDRPSTILVSPEPSGEM